MKTKKTPLEQLQDRIDKCNHHSGCNSCCSRQAQEQCRLLRAHAERIDACTKSGISVALW